MPRFPLNQSRYQVRLDWGAAGLARLAVAEITVIVDVLSVDPGEAESVEAAVAPASRLIRGSLRNAAAVADAIVQAQRARGGRLGVAVIAVGEQDADGLRPAIEDQLGAGAIVDALIERGIDHVSPEAILAAEAFRALRGSLRHLVGASASGHAVLAAGREAEVALAAELNADADGVQVG